MRIRAKTTAPANAARASTAAVVTRTVHARSSSIACWAKNPKAAAWSSGDPERLESLYASDARRVEGLYGVGLRGIDEITDHAGFFFDRHPGARWTIVDPYIFTSGLLSGAVFTLTEPDGCEIGMAVLVEVDDAGSISEERIYHDIEAIQTCGWQR